jgi:hypothetical protein
MLDIILGDKATEGKCYNHPDPDWFHIPGTGDNLKAQKEFCDGCKIFNECLDYAVRNDVSGVWGGTTTRERKMIRRSMGLKVIPISLREVGSNVS